MSYRDIENKYLNAGIQGHYKLANANEVLNILGYDIKNIEGFDKLSAEDQLLAEILICKYINGYGLEAREKLSPPKKIIRGSCNFIVTFQDHNYSYLFDNGSVG